MEGTETTNKSKFSLWLLGNMVLQPFIQWQNKLIRIKIVFIGWVGDLMIFVIINLVTRIFYVRNPVAKALALKLAFKLSNLTTLSWQLVSNFFSGNKIKLKIMTEEWLVIDDLKQTNLCSDFFNHDIVSYF